jgi:hypothetical protein
MRRSALLLLIGFIFSFASAHEITFLSELSEKNKVTFGDAVAMYMYTLGKAPEKTWVNYDAALKVLKEMKLLKADRYDKDKPLRRGMLALMIARQLRLKGSLFYLMFDTERYAFRACVAAKIMDADGSEWDTMTGDELIEIMTIVSQRMEGKQSEGE